MYIVRLISFFKQFKNESDYSNAIQMEDLKNILILYLKYYRICYLTIGKVEDYLKNSKDYNLDPVDIISSEQNIEILECRRIF